MKAWQSALALGVAALIDGALASGAAVARASAPPPPTVVLLRLEASDGVTTEAMSRVNGELKAAGFDVAIVASKSENPKRELETAGRELDAIAAFAIFVRPSEPGTSVAEIWVSDRIRQKIVIQDAVLHETDRGRGSEILAVRAVELLKANLAAFWTPAQAAPPAPAPATNALAAGPPSREGDRTRRPPFASGLGAGLGAGVVESFDAVGPGWSYDAVVSYGWPHGFSLRANLVGVGSEATLSATNGSANVTEELVVLEAVKTWWPRAALVPFVSAGAGAAHFRVAGVGDAPYQGHTADVWSVVSTVGIGLGIPVVRTLSIVVQARGCAAWSPAAVQIVGAEVGRVGVPALLADGGLFGTLP